MSEKMRNEFEEWFVGEYSFTPFKYMDGSYVSAATKDGWAAWQASRAALVVELPSSLEYPSSDYDYASEAFEETIGGVKSSLDAAGVSYK